MPHTNEPVNRQVFVDVVKGDVKGDVGYLSYLLPQAPVDHWMCDV